jgi:crotonobetainyl-CoA:carnitine CoA-transferase CaiB-like acyl-CoA transferase
MQDPPFSSSAGPLAGVRVIDFTSMVSGPFATSLLADQGADVIKLEAPGTGDLLRHMGYSRGGLSAIFNTVNRNKRSLVVDLHDERGVEIVRRLVGTAQVFIQNYRPGVCDALGVGEPDLRRDDAGLVYVSISGFGREGPYASHPAYDVIIQALSGMAVLQADPQTGSPDLIQTVLCDKVAALLAAQAISSALFARERSGQGRHIELSLLDAALAFLWPDGMEAQTLLGEGVTVPATGMRDVARIHATKDGHLTLMVVSDDHFAGLCRALSLPDLANDPRFRDVVSRMENGRELNREVGATLARLERDAICARLREEGVPAGPVLTPEDVVADPHVRATEVLEQIAHPLSGLLRTPRPAARFDGFRSPELRPAPALGQHSREILTELHLRPSQIDSLAGAGVVQLDE